MFENLLDGVNLILHPLVFLLHQIELHLLLDPLSCLSLELFFKLGQGLQEPVQLVVDRKFLGDHIQLLGLALYPPRFSLDRLLFRSERDQIGRQAAYQFCL